MPADEITNRLAEMLGTPLENASQLPGGQNDPESDRAQLPETATPCATCGGVLDCGPAATDCLDCQHADMERAQAEGLALAAELEANDEAACAAEREAILARESDLALETEREHGQEDAPTDPDTWCREHPHLCTGRGGTGRLRNFRAMSDEKLDATIYAVRQEGNDPVALEALTDERLLRDESL